jgi:hypothetical protein
MPWFGKASPQRLSARVGLNQTKAPSVVVDVDSRAPLPELLVIVPDSTYLKVQRKLEKTASSRAVASRGSRSTHSRG